jgi:hypothetical protein
MKERDSLTSSDDMGEIVHIIDTDEYGLGIGTHTAKSSSGDYTLTYEIRRAPLPDLRPVDIKVQDQPGTAKKLVCLVVLNSDSAADAGPFDATLRIGGAIPSGGIVKSDGVVSGYWRDLCVETEPFSRGEHSLSATVDELGALPEFNESNNILERKYVASGPAPAS